jgi:hypothetical protein
VSEASHLADAILGLYSAEDHGWFTPITVSTAGLSFHQAARIPAPKFNSVWGTLNHIRFWQEYTHLRLQAQTVDRVALGADDGWPQLPDLANEEIWQADRRRAMEAVQKLSSLVGAFSDEELEAPYAEDRPARYQIIHGIIAHNCYHACEIISIRHMLGWWLERT